MKYRALETKLSELVSNIHGLNYTTFCHLFIYINTTAATSNINTVIITVFDTTNDIPATDSTTNNTTTFT